MELDLEFIETPRCKRCGELIMPMTPDEELDLRAQSLEDNDAMHPYGKPYLFRLDVSL